MCYEDTVVVLKPQITLHTARNMLSDPFNWVQGAKAKDRDGNEVYPTDDVACRFSVTGAVLRALHTVNLPDGQKLDSFLSFAETLKFLAKAKFQDTPKQSNVSTYRVEEQLDDWNDQPTTRHEDVMALLDKAIRIPMDDE